jgi:uncharacterized protein (TIGR02996 family)
MNHDVAFLQAIVENPGDTASRLVYADWLEEQGDELAADLREEGLLKIWANGTVFWHLEQRKRTWLLGRLDGLAPPCHRCGRTDGERVWRNHAWRCPISSCGGVE